jgi:hypothetical protein
VAAGGTAVLLLEDAGTAASPRRDSTIFRFLLELEYIQEAFYAEARRAGALDGELLRFAEIVGRHEREHVAAVEQIVGPGRERPTLQFGDSVRSPEAFAAAALTLEETTAAAYIVQGASLTAGRMTTAARIVSVEARHAAWMRDMEGRLPAPNAADPAKTAKQAMAAIERTGFVRER